MVPIRANSATPHDHVDVRATRQTWFTRRVSRIAVLGLIEQVVCFEQSLFLGSCDATSLGVLMRTIVNTVASLRKSSAGEAH